MHSKLPYCLVVLALTACHSTDNSMSNETPTMVNPRVELSLSPFVESGGHFSGAAKSIVALKGATAQFAVANKKQGIELFDDNAQKKSAIGNGEYVVMTAFADGDFLLSQDRRSGEVHVFQWRTEDNTLLQWPTLTKLNFRVEATCAGDFRGNHYVFFADEEGHLDQYLIAQQAQQWQARFVRRLPIGTAVSACAVDRARGDVYVAEADVALWRYPLDPEVELQRKALAVNGINGEWSTVTAMTIANVQQQTVLVVMHDGERVALYQDRDSFKQLASITLASTSIDKIDDSESLAISADNKRLYVQDDADDKDGSNIKVFAFDTVLAALPTLADVSQHSDDAVLVVATAETTPVQSDGDAADDPAIWVNQKTPSASLILGTQKQAGLAIYDLNGKLLHFREDGKLNNVDLRQSLHIDGREIDIAVASNRSNNSVIVYEVSAQMPFAQDKSQGGLLTDLAEIYGICLYKPAADKLDVIATDKKGRLQQWHLRYEATQWQLQAVRQWQFDGLIEGCVADDQQHLLWIAEEDRGLWQIDLSKDNADKQLIADVTHQLVADVEGVSIWMQGEQEGYIVVSSQGDNRYALFERRAPHRFVRNVRVVADPLSGIDGASETDGLDVSSANFGGEYAQGLLVVQDGRNVMPSENQNFKLVPWSRLMTAIKP